MDRHTVHFIIDALIHSKKTQFVYKKRGGGPLKIIMVVGIFLISSFSEFKQISRLVVKETSRPCSLFLIFSLAGYIPDKSWTLISGLKVFILNPLIPDKI